MTREEVERSVNPDVYWEAMREISHQGETVGYEEWTKENQKLFQGMEVLLAEFYKDREVPEDLRLRLEQGASEFRIHNGGADYRDVEEDTSEAERVAHAERLKLYRNEMKEFAGFLIEKFL